MKKLTIMEIGDLRRLGMENYQIGDRVLAWDCAGGFRGGDGASGAWYVAVVTAIDATRGKITVNFIDAIEDGTEIAEVNFAEVRERRMPPDVNAAADWERKRKYGYEK